MPEHKITYVAELVDPTTGHTVELTADTATELEALVQEHLDETFPAE